MNGLEHMVKGCNRLWKEGKLQETKHAASEGVSTIMSCRQRSCTEHLYTDEMCEFYVFLALVTLEEGEYTGHVMSHLFSQASEMNQEKTVYFFCKHVSNLLYCFA